MEIKLLCVQCMKEISPEGNYIVVEELDNKKTIKRNYMHKSCWELLMDDKGTKRQAMGMLKNVMSKLNNMGIES